MAGSVNKVILVGNLGRDPEVKTFQNGGKLCNLRIATSESWRDKQSGERKERTEWHSVVITNEALVKVAEQYLKKGTTVYIEGQLNTRKWQDQSGADRYSTEIAVKPFTGILTMIGSRDGAAGGEGDRGYSGGQGDSRRGGSSGGSGQQQSRGDGGGGQSRQDFDDDIPF